MARRNLSLFVLFVSLLFIFIGCEEANPSRAGGSSEALDQAHGSWEFDDGTSVVLAVDPTGETNSRDFYVDLEKESTIYHIEGSGTLEGNTINGTYTYTTDTTAEKDLGSLRETSNESLEISITLEQEGDNVTVSCTGEGPLANETFQGGSEPTYTSEDLYGDWLFPDGVFFSLMSYDDDSANNSTMDIHNHTTETEEYSFYGSGALEGFAIAGTYHYSRITTDPESEETSWYTYGDDKSEPHHPITMNISFIESRMTINCNTSAGPLTGLTFSGGVKLPTP
jgi:hypothetical protein